MKRTSKKSLSPAEKYIADSLKHGEPKWLLYHRALEMYVARKISLSRICDLLVNRLGFTSNADVVRMRIHDACHHIGNGTLGGVREYYKEHGWSYHLWPLIKE